MVGLEEKARAQRAESAEGAQRSLLADPPLLDRLTWREGIQPQTLISRDRGLMARTFGTLFLVGGAVGLLILLVAESVERDDAVIAALSIVALMLGALCFVLYRRLPAQFFGAMLALGTLMISGAAGGASEGAEGVYGFFYVWIVFLAFLFFSPRVAAAQTLFAAVAYAVVIFASDTPFAVSLLISAAATIGTTGALMGLLVSRMERVAAGSVADAHTDPVTAIANRRDFDERFENEVARARMSGNPMSLVICDLDRFKAVNDALGHEEGDLALRRAAAAIAGAVRSIDAVARLGGEEFAVILPNAGRDEATVVADRVRTAITDEFASYEVPLTGSCGVASTADVGELRDELFRAADGALYAAKAAGRDCTVAFNGD